MGNAACRSAANTYHQTTPASFPKIRKGKRLLGSGQEPGVRDQESGDRVRKDQIAFALPHFPSGREAQSPKLPSINNLRSIPPTSLPKKSEKGSAAVTTEPSSITNREHVLP